LRKTITIAISAVSGGGKTTIIELLNKQITNSKALFFDDYHFEGSENFIDWVKRGADYNEWNLKLLIEPVQKAQF
jgi:uridine kinase